MLTWDEVLDRLRESSAASSAVHSKRSGRGRAGPRRQQFAAGEITIDDLDGAVEDLAEVTQSHRDAVIRHRRAMLELNTAVGLRLLP